MLTFVVPAAAQIQGPMTAVQLRALCASKYDVDFGICAGYVTAVAERLMADPRPEARMCLSPAITPQTLVANIEKAWGDLPPRPDETASDNVEGVLRSRFRCP